MMHLFFFFLHNVKHFIECTHPLLLLCCSIFFLCRVWDGKEMRSKRFWKCLSSHSTLWKHVDIEIAFYFVSMHLLNYWNERIKCEWNKENKKKFASNYSDVVQRISHHQLMAVPIERSERTIETLTWKIMCRRSVFHAINSTHNNNYIANSATLNRNMHIDWIWVWCILILLIWKIVYLKSRVLLLLESLYVCHKFAKATKLKSNDFYSFDDNTISNSFSLFH